MTEYTPISVDEFIYELEDGIEWTNTNNEIVRYGAEFKGESAYTKVDVYRDPFGFWTWEAEQYVNRHDAWDECCKDTWTEAARDAYYELLKRHWI